MSEAPQTSHGDGTEALGAAPVAARPKSPRAILMSRRVLMRAAAIAPVIALGRKAWADPNPTHLAAFAAAAPVPATALAAVLAKAKTAQPGIDESKAELVARSLWTHFHFGLGEIGVWSESELLQLMYDEKLNDGLTMTGNRIAEHIKNEKFDPLGNDYQTNVCAYLCGHKAAVIAASPPQPKTKIDKAMYQAARKEVETEMKMLGGGGSGFGC